MNMEQVRVRFELDPKDQQGYKVENLWAERIEDSQFRILNSPFFAFGVSYDDIVRAQKEDDGFYRFDGIVRRGGHSTYRIFLQRGETIDNDGFRRYWHPIAELHCVMEKANNKLAAVDIPPGVNVSDVYRLLQNGEDAGVWVFEEAYYVGN